MENSIIVKKMANILFFLLLCNSLYVLCRHGDESPEVKPRSGRYVAAVPRPAKPKMRT